ncbi:MAG: polyisoprenoid-binding protein [Proteobacteria bacterium]|nr:polyisoprenoid-binding protein [Pseudomonadota bacterium]
MVSLIFTLMMLISIPAQAAPEKYIYDPAHTQIFFSVNHLGFSNPSGRFDKFSGSFVFDQEKPETSHAEITIDVKNGLNMDSAKWEEHLKSKDFFDAEKFPTMTFKSTKIVKTGDKTAAMTGDLTLLGVTKPVTLNVTFNKAGTFPMNKNYVAGFSMAGSLKRSDFGMNGFLPMISDEVMLSIQVEGIRQDFENISK